MRGWPVNQLVGYRAVYVQFVKDVPKRKVPPTGQAGANDHAYRQAGPELHVIQDPARMGWKPVVKVEHYYVGANEVFKSEDRA